MQQEQKYHLTMERKLNEILELTRDNNRMLREIIGFINAFGRNITQENAEDFGRNVLANLLSNGLKTNRFKL